MTTTHEAIIRKARLDDYAQACRLLDALDELHRDQLPWLLKVPDVQPRSEAFFADLLNRDDSAVFVADAGELVGIAFGILRTAPALAVFIQQRWGVLDGLIVDQAWRRRGVGKRLMQSFESWAHELGAPWIEINVYEFSAEARRFYESLGYLTVSTKLRKPNPGPT